MKILSFIFLPNYIEKTSNFLEFARSFSNQRFYEDGKENQIFEENKQF